MSVKNNRLLKKLKRTTACWLTAAMVLSCFGTVAGAATSGDANDTSLYGEISVGKSAEWTNEDKYIGKVKLSVPGEEATKKIAVVFAVDRSNSTADAEFPAAAKKFVSDLGQKKKLDVKVGVVVGDSVAYDAIRETSDGQETGLLDITTGSSAIDRALDTPFKDYVKEGDRYIGGSNSQALVLKAEEILDGADTDTDKYIVLLTDMYTYIYNGNLTTADGRVHDSMPCSKDLGFTNASTKEQTADGAFLQQYNDSLTSPQTGSSEGGQHFTNVQFTSWENLYYTYTHEKNKLDLMGWNRDTICRCLDSAYHLLGSDFNDAAYQERTAPGKPWSGFAGYDSHSVTGAEKSAVLTYEECVHAMTKPSGCHISLVSTMEADDRTESYHTDYHNNAYKYLHGMVEALATEYPGSFTKYFTKDTSWKDESEGIFDSIKDEILYAITKGTVSDAVGDKYTLCNQAGEDITSTDLSNSDFEMTLGGQTLKLTWNDGKLEYRDDSGNLLYSAAYDPGSKTIRWDIGTPVLKAEPVTLSYYVRVTEPQWELGTYSNATNESARLSYWSSGDDTSSAAAPHAIDFPQPSLSYYVPGEGITVSKSWKDNQNAARKRPAAVTVELLENGVVYDTVTLSEANSWHAVWKDLRIFATPANASESDALAASTSNADDGSLADGIVGFTVSNGKRITWTVKETDVPTDYTASVSDASDEANNSVAFTVANTYSPSTPHHSGSSGGGSGSGTTTISGTKVPLTGGDTTTIGDTPEPLAVGPDADIIESEDVPRARLPRTGETEKTRSMLILLMTVVLLLGFAVRKRPGER